MSQGWARDRTDPSRPVTSLGFAKTQMVSLIFDLLLPQLPLPRSAERPSPTGLSVSPLLKCDTGRLTCVLVFIWLVRGVVSTLAHVYHDLEQSGKMHMNHVQCVTCASDECVVGERAVDEDTRIEGQASPFRVVVEICLIFGVTARFT